MTELTMPKLSDSMTQGTILTWLKTDGEQVNAGEDLLEIETDKATVTHPAEASGTLKIIAREGTTLPVGEPIASVEAAVGAVAPVAGATNGNTNDPAVATGPGSDLSGAKTSITSSTRADPGPDAIGSLIRATPLARRVAAAHGISLDEVTGSGPLGRITRSDVLSRAGIQPERATTAQLAPPVDPSTPAPSIKGTVEVVQPTRVQSVVARRMSEAKATVPHFQVQTDVVMDAAASLREQIKKTGADAPSLNDLVIKAAAVGLRAHPLANAAYRDGHFELYSRINVGIAVAADHALVVPTIFDADLKSLGTIAAESRQLAARVREGRIAPSELSGATFTVSNLGMYGMTAITPVVNPPQAAILGVGAMRDSLARVDGEIVDRRLMSLTLSCDHRILYGADAAEFLATVRGLLEAPLRLVL
jgi:pyruvate dehydrogenase E2 component (dihydrolipoamide acetyltransferase)